MHVSRKNFYPFPKAPNPRGSSKLSKQTRFKTGIVTTHRAPVPGRYERGLLGFVGNSFRSSHLSSSPEILSYRLTRS